MLQKSLYVSLFLFIFFIFSITNVTYSQSVTKTQVLQALKQLEKLHTSKRISQQDYVDRKKKLVEIYKNIENKASSMSRSPKVYSGIGGHPYALTKEGCNYADFSKLDAVIRPMGFKAGAGGGYIKNKDLHYYCGPCLKRIDDSKKLSKQQLEKLYQPVVDIIPEYASGYDYEFCTIKNY